MNSSRPTVKQNRFRRADPYVRGREAASLHIIRRNSLTACLLVVLVLVATPMAAQDHAPRIDRAEPNSTATFLRGVITEGYVLTPQRGVWPSPALLPITQPGLTLVSADGISPPRSGAPGTVGDFFMHSPYRANFTLNDEVGWFGIKYGAIAAMAAPRVSEGLVIINAPRLTAHTTQGGDILSGEFLSQLEGMAPGGAFRGSLFGVYGHADFRGTGNGATLDAATAGYFDIGHFSSGSNYTVTKAVSLAARNPEPADVGTFSSRFAIYSDGAVGVGPWPATGKSFKDVVQAAIIAPTSSNGAVITINTNASTAGLILNQAADMDTSGVLIANGTVTGTRSQPIINVLQTWNTTGSPVALQINITNAASGGGARLINLQVDGTTVLSIDVGGQIRTAQRNEAEGSGNAGFGPNCPARSCAAPYKWLKFTTSDGSQVYVPAWK